MESIRKETQHYVHFHGSPMRGKILMIASSSTISEQTGWKVGFWASELTHPLLSFHEAGYEVDIASTQGGEIEMDTLSDPSDPNSFAANDVITLGYMQREWFREKLKHTLSIALVNPDDYDAIFLIGGQGPVYTYRCNKELEQLFLAFFSAEKPAAAICHATCLLLDLKTESGEYWVKGKSWTGFTSAEEEISNQALGLIIQPYSIEEEALKIPGTFFRTAPAFSSFAVRDGMLITGQQHNSGASVARIVIDILDNL